MVTLTTAENALKTLYLGVISDQLNTKTNPLFNKISQSTADVWGKDVKKLLPIGINGGIGAGDESGLLPSAAQNTYLTLTSTLKNLFGSIELSDKAIRASANNAGAFVNLLNAEMEGLLKASKFNFGRMLYGDGSGKLANITAAVSSQSQITLDSTKNVIEGMVIDAYNNPTTPSIISSLAGARIVSINRANNTVVLDKQFSSGTFVFGTNSYFLTVQNSLNREITGLAAIFDNDTIYGYNRSAAYYLQPVKKAMEASEELTDIKIQTVIDQLEEHYGSEVDFIVCSAGVKRAYQSYLASFRSNVDYMDLSGGYKAISFNGIPVVSDRFAPKGTMFLLNTKEFVLHQLCDWRWLEGEDGKVIKQIPGKPVYNATLVKYAELICDKLAGQGRITNITEC